MRLTVRAARVNRGITQAEMARRMDLSVAVYAKIEKDPSLMTLAQASRLVEILGLDIDDILFGQDSSFTGFGRGVDRDA